MNARHRQVLCSAVHAQVNKTQPQTAEVKGYERSRRALFWTFFIVKTFFEVQGSMNYLFRYFRIEVSSSLNEKAKEGVGIYLK